MNDCGHDFSATLTEMVGELFIPHDMPEAPKASFFQGLFGGGVRNLDREELCKFCGFPILTRKIDSLKWKLLNF